MSQFAFDVFVSYSHKDRAWVVEELVPALRGAGLRVLIDDDFRAGATVVRNMREAVQQSRRTLLVMSPAWKESEWAEFEGVLATVHDPAGRDRRVIPLLYRDCDLEEFRHLTWRDYREPTAEAWRKLLEDLEAEDPAASTPRPAAHERSAKEALDALLGIADGNQAVRRALLSYDIDLEEVRRQVDLVEDAKAVHKVLQELEASLRVVCEDVNRLRTGRGRWSEVSANVTSFEIPLDRLLQLLESASLESLKTVWKESAYGTWCDLETACERKDLELLAAAARSLQRFLGRQQSKMNGNLVERAAALRLPRLVEWLRTVVSNLPEEAASVVSTEKLETAAADLEARVAEFESLVDRHNSWQEVDDQLRSVEMALSSSFGPGELRYEWSELRDKTKSLAAGEDESLEPMLLSVEKLDRALSEDRRPDEIHELFLKVRAKTLRGFNRIDNRMLGACGQWQTYDSAFERLQEKSE